MTLGVGEVETMADCRVICLLLCAVDEGFSRKVVGTRTTADDFDNIQTMLLMGLVNALTVVWNNSYFVAISGTSKE